MLEATKVIGLIGSTSGTNDKLYLLKKYASIPGLKEILRFIYNPYCKTGISTAKLAKFTGKEFSREIEWQDAIDYFSKHQTGADADIMFAREFINFTLNKYGAATAKLAEALVTQNLKMGVSVTSLNKVYGSNFIPKTGCMLGTLYSSVGHDKVQWPCIVTEKLDGVRRILVKEKGVCKFYSRSGHEDTGLVEILEEAKSLPDNYVYDGELLAKGTFKDSIAQRQATNSIANCSGAKTGLIFNIFDMIPVSDFYNGVCARPALERKILLAATFNDDSLHFIDEDWARRICAFGMYMKFDHIATVPILGKVNSLLEAEPIVEEIWARGGEGIMLNTVKGPYEIKRTKHLLKVKHTEEHILKVVGIIEGTGKYEEAMGAILVDYKGSKVGVGSGFTDAQRYEIWENPEKYIGRMAEIETFGESTSMTGSVSLNCPIFKRFVGEVE